MSFFTSLGVPGFWFLTSEFGSEFGCASPKGSLAPTHLMPEIKTLVAGFIVTNLPKKSDLYVISGQWNVAKMTAV